MPLVVHGSLELCRLRPTLLLLLLLLLQLMMMIPTGRLTGMITHRLLAMNSELVALYHSHRHHHCYYILR